MAKRRLLIIPGGSGSQPCPPCPEPVLNEITLTWDDEDIVIVPPSGVDGYKKITIKKPVFKYFTITPMGNQPCAVEFRGLQHTLEYRDNVVSDWTELEGTLYIPEDIECEIRAQIPVNAMSNVNMSVDMGQCRLSGDISSLIHPNGTKELNENISFSEFFMGDGIIDVSELVLPFKEVHSFCYLNMFMGQPITAAPIMRADILRTYSCSSMFNDCFYMTRGMEINASMVERNAINYLYTNCGMLEEIPYTSLTQYNDLYTQDWLLGAGTENPIITIPTGSVFTNDVSGIPDKFEIRYR